MTSSEAYVKHADFPKSVAIEIVPSLTSRVEWKEGCRVIDVGCGPGNVTREVLLPNLPKSIKTIVGIDKCPDFVKYAKIHYEWAPITSFRLMDIVDDDVPGELEGYFDYAFSLFCFHQFHNHEAAFSNVARMLKPAGEFLCYFPITSSSVLVYKAFAEDEKWKHYFSDYETYRSPYNESSDIKEELETMLAFVGFKICFLKVEEKKHKFYVKDFPYTCSSFGITVPDRLMDELIEDIPAKLKSLDLIKVGEDDEEYLDYTYNLVTLHLVKND
ncbi:hypothetical protein PPYR_07220 [Photinus pyralis]|uniref:Methyltransferase type 11 domain-containing protein n=1 Tax=Photinus pyralis TaxID=7054 RepID=A0A5N4APS7_PHOPY|nr:juvenile hormone acid O-methyltransferase-like [Photinus pyralis]KAB0799340.1 hypothetical protein PPYR_07220 [Photinus pyralis]